MDKSNSTGISKNKKTAPRDVFLLPDKMAALPVLIKQEHILSMAYSFMYIYICFEKINQLQNSYSKLYIGKYYIRIS